jgi:hypothetical protein
MSNFFQTLSLIISASTACVTIAGWYAVNQLSIKREDRARKLDAHKKHLERQIEEFYGPLFNIIIRLESAVEIQNKILAERSRKGIDSNSNEMLVLRRFVKEQFTRPLNAQIEKILAEKLYLVGSRQIPLSFRSFLNHSIQNDLQYRLWSEKNVSTLDIDGIPFPRAFKLDVETTLYQLRNEYFEIQGLTRTSPTLHPEAFATDNTTPPKKNSVTALPGSPNAET